jgi:tetratricopeptide (TPR) repeat protein
MIKIVISILLLGLYLFGDDALIKSLIPQNYDARVIKKDFNNDKKNDIILSLENIKENKRKLIILKNNVDNNFTQILNSEKSLALPSKDYIGQAIIDIFIDKVEKDYIIINVSLTKGLSYKYFFKFKKDKFLLEKILESNRVYCNVDNPIFFYEVKDIKPVVYLEDFSFESFNNKYFKKLRLHKKFKRVIENSFLENHKKLKKLYLTDLNKFKRLISSLLLYDYNKNTNCLPEEYLDRYLYLDYKQTISKSNDIAFFFEQAGYYKEAVYLLEKIIKKFPNRTVAYYNLGDAYWELGEKDKAIKAYTTYIEQMCDKGLQKKIPKEVLKRVEVK